MATFSITAGPFVIGDRKLTVGEVDLDSSYPTGGESFTLADLGFSTSLDLLDVEAAGGYTFETDYTNLKIIARYADYDAASDGPLIQVPNTTNLSAVADVRFFAIGR